MRHYMRIHMLQDEDEADSAQAPAVPVKPGKTAKRNARR